MDVFATCGNLPDINPDDRLVADILHSRGISVTAAVWDDPAVDWTRFDCVVIIEPFLTIGSSPTGAVRFADAIEAVSR